MTKYVMEGCRLSTIAPQLNRVVAKDAVVNDGGKQVHCKEGDIIFLNLVCPSFQSVNQGRGKPISRNISRAKESQD